MESLQPDISHVVRVRYGGMVTPLNLTPKNRLRQRTRNRERVFEISSVIEVDERRRELLVGCTERVGVDG